MTKFIAGLFRQQYKYKSFLPARVPLDYKWADRKIDFLLERANRNLGELNAYSSLVPDIDFFIRMHVIKEATASSRIEGTKTNIDEALLSEEEISPEKKDDWQEVINYMTAMNEAISKLSTLPLSIRLLKETHATLLDGVRGKHKDPGEFRKSQNWIGGSNLENALFIPPSHEEVPDLTTDLEKFWHLPNSDMPHLVRVAISHYQFETIHPFLDGNGRLGRLLITLYLVANNILKRPTLYLSDFFEKNRASYYNSLQLVRETHDLDQWLRFFLVGVEETAIKAKTTLEQITIIRRACETKIISLGKKSKIGQQLLLQLFSQPIISVNKAKEILVVKSHQRVNSLFKDFEQLGILEEVTGHKRNRLFIFKEYVRLFV